MGHGDHKIWSPKQRWMLLAAYWATSFALANARGLVTYLLEQEVKAPNHWMYLVGFIAHIPCFLAAWDYSAYGFNRKLDIVASIIYPIMHNCDTLRWFYTFDLGRGIIKFLFSLLSWEAGMTIQFLGGWGAFALFMMIHRGTFELSYLPEHRKFQSNLIFFFISILCKRHSLTELLMTLLCNTCRPTQRN